MRCHTHTYMYTAYQMSSCSVSSLNCCERAFFFFYLPAAFCCWSLFPSFSASPFPPPPSRLMLNLLLRLPPNTIHPPPLPPCLQEFVPHYRSLLHPNQPSHPAWCHSFSTVLSHYLRRLRRGRALWDIRHSPSVRGLWATDRADRWLSQAKGFIWPYLDAEHSFLFFACASWSARLSWATLVCALLLA